MEKFYRPFAIGAHQWPAGASQPAATLAVNPEVLADWFGVRFERGADERDDYRAAGLELPSGRRVMLWWYERAPEPRGMRVLADRNDDPAAACDETLMVLGLCAGDVMWRPGTAAA